MIMILVSVRLIYIPLLLGGNEISRGEKPHMKIMIYHNSTFILRHASVYTIWPSTDSFYRVTCNINWAKTSWTYSIVVTAINGRYKRCWL